jgi:hypothetical protein
MEELLPHSYFDRHTFNNLWVYEANRMKCLTCGEGEKENFSNYNDQEEQEYEEHFWFDKDEDWFGTGSDAQKIFNMRGFSEIDASGMCSLQIKKGDTYKVAAFANEDVLEALQIAQKDRILHISTGADRCWFWKKNNQLRIEIITPRLENVDLSGATHATISGFSPDEMQMKLSGASFARLNIDANTFRLDASGASKVILHGNARNAEVTMTGASRYLGYDFKIRNADFTLSGASSSEIYASEHLRIDAGGVSKARYKGHPAVIKELSAMSKLYQEE